MTKATQRKVLGLGVTWLLAIVSILPILWHWTPPAPNPSINLFATALAYLAAVAFCWLIYWWERKRLDPSRAIVLTLLIFVLTHVALFMHHFVVDLGSLMSWPTDTVWQEQLQQDVIHLSVAALPHSYRFLPNSLVLWMQMAGVQYAVGRDIYELLSGLPLFYVFYRFARAYTGYLGAVIAMLLTGVMLPVSFVGYSGQLADPLSYLSFLLAFIFLETEDFSFFLTTLLIGSLAKESVLALTGFYVLFCRRQKHYAVKTALLCVASVAVYLGVRMFVLHGTMGYQQTSGVTADHILVNLGLKPWRMHLLLTVGAYMPFLVLGWKTTPAMLKKLVLYLFPVLFVSSLVFSWLNEARNFMPLVFVLAVAAARYLESFQEPRLPATPAMDPVDAG